MQPIVSIISTIPGLYGPRRFGGFKTSKFMEILGLPIVAMIFDTKFMGTLVRAINYGLRALTVQHIIPEIMEIMEIISVTNSFHDFCYQTHGNY